MTLIEDLLYGSGDFAQHLQPLCNWNLEMFTQRYLVGDPTLPSLSMYTSTFHYAVGILGDHEHVVHLYQDHFIICLGSVQIFLLSDPNIWVSP